MVPPSLGGKQAQSRRVILSARTPSWPREGSAWLMDPEQIEVFNKQVLAFGEELINSGEFILRELPNVGLPEDLRLRVFDFCSDDLKGAWLGILQAVAIDHSTVGAEGRAQLINRFRETLSKQHAVVLELRAASERDSHLAGAAILVGESATNILGAFQKVLEATDPPR